MLNGNIFNLAQFNIILNQIKSGMYLYYGIALYLLTQNWRFAIG